MKVLLVNHLLDAMTGGGTAERTFQLARAFAQTGVEPVVLTLDIGLDEMRRRDLRDIKVVALPCIFRRYFLPGPSWRRLKREVAAADVIHVMGHWTLLNALVYFAARGVGRPYVVCPAGSLRAIGRSRWLKALYNRLVGRRVIRNAAAHIAITRDEVAQFTEYGVAPDAVTVIPNGTPIAIDAPPDCHEILVRRGLGSRRFLLFLGRLSYIKGPDLLLEAYARIASEYPDIALVFAGPDDGMLHGLRARAGALRVEERVRLIGYVGGTEKACILAACQFLVIPSRKEAMSIVALEAGAYSKPVLLTDQCGFSEVEQAGGGLVTAADVDSIEHALRQMMADRQRLEEMGMRLRNYVQEHYAWDKAAAEYLAVFRAAGGGH